MFEDKEENLRVPHELGMITVWINHRARSPMETESLPKHDHVHHLCETISEFLERTPADPGSITSPQA